MELETPKKPLQSAGNADRAEAEQRREKRERTILILLKDSVDVMKDVQGSAKRWALGCVNLPSTARGSQEVGYTQPRAQPIPVRPSSHPPSLLGE